ncbi:fumarylacetoacetase [Methylobacterium sp. 4-46]|uniref:fumarylacetoacetase n=1 Tax=unclassified Methylobacterium TaxID=2615210 RepID=UPI000152D1FF|nr:MULTISPECIES: fumarylacetoacetase [Methylobacterium]ACA16976.1 fumarylacetoacetase [Methylobacterium sp. 4-46]WFT82664.1 fumarylacetoacetase [Methylobacterium nodulans]
MADIDATHAATLRSWVPGANGHSDFPIQNLPLGVFSPGDGTPRAGVAIGGRILDLPALLAANLLSGEAALAAEAAGGTTLNRLLALGAGPRRALRARLSALFAEGSPDRDRVAPLLHEASSCRLHLPAAIGDYTDFYVGIHHAENIGRQFRPDNPLLPNYKHVPIGYHGRASSIRPSGTPVRRPRGQSKPPEAGDPVFGPSRRLDYELELGVWIGPGNTLGEPIAIGDAHAHIAGVCLLNDWSARDIQAWEYQPLGPFLAKNFATTISPWIVTAEALAPFRIAQSPRPEGDPRPLPYLTDEVDQRRGAFDLRLEVLLLTPGLRAAGLGPHRISASNTRHMYWTVAQMVAHHTGGGCNLQPGDLLGTGTISGPDRDACGSLLEATLGGREPLRLASGEERRFLEDGDEVILRARGVRDTFAPIGFGECRAELLGAAP